MVILECSRESLLQRLGPHARFDDTVEIIGKRLDTFRNATAEVVGSYEVGGKATRINAEEGIEEVYARLKDVLLERKIFPY